MPLGATKTGLMAAAGAGGAFKAFGGIITQYVDDSGGADDGKTFRVHTFRGSGKFVVSSGSANVDWLIVAGGAGNGGS